MINKRLATLTPIHGNDSANSYKRILLHHFLYKANNGH